MKRNLKKMTLFTIVCTLYSVGNGETKIPYTREVICDVLSTAAEGLNIFTLDSTDANTQRIAAVIGIINRALQVINNSYKITETTKNNKKSDNTINWSDRTHLARAGLEHDEKNKRITNSGFFINETNASLGVETISACLIDVPTLTKSKQLALYNKNTHRQRRLTGVKASQALWLACNTLLKFVGAHYQAYKYDEATQDNDKNLRSINIIALRTIAFWSEIARRYILYKAKFKGLDEWVEDNMPEETAKFLLPHAYTIPSTN